MRNVKIICLFLSLMLILCLVSGCNSTPEATADLTNITLSDKQLSDIETKTHKTLVNNKFSGTAVVTLNGEEIFINSYGYADSGKDKKNTEKSVYQLGSLTKTFTGISVLQLVAKGKIKLTDTLDKYFDGKNYLENITVQHLLEMRSGLVSYTVELQNDKDEFNKIKKMIADNPNDTKIKSFVRDYILKAGVDGAIGNFNHSHSDYYLLGLIIEDVSKMSFEEYIEKNIVKPLKLKNTGFINNDVSAKGYEPDTKKWKTNKDNSFLNNKYVMFSSLGITSDVNDVNKLYEAILSNDVLGKNKDKSSCITRILRSSSDYSCGFYVENNCIYSESNTDLHCAHSYINTDTKEIAVLLSNHNDNDKIKTLTKEVYNVTNAKINGIIFDSIK